jgi:hypothetical protein
MQVEGNRILRNIKRVFPLYFVFDQSTLYFISVVKVELFHYNVCFGGVGKTT